MKASAKQRLAALVDPAIHRLGQLVRHGRPDAVALGAVRDALDRAGFGKPARVELSGSVRLDGLRARLDEMGPERSGRLAELLGRPTLTEAEARELRELRGAAGLPDEADS